MPSSVVVGVMLNWMTKNSDWLNVVANWAMVAIWIVYLQVFLRSFRRQTLPKIVINQAAGSSLDAACFISNMSSEAIYIEASSLRSGAVTTSLPALLQISSSSKNGRRSMIQSTAPSRDLFLPLRTRHWLRSRA